MKATERFDLDRRGLIALAGAGALAVLAGCGQGAGKAAPGSVGSAPAPVDLTGTKLTFVGDDAFAPYRYIETGKDGKTRVTGLDIAIADEMAKRLGFEYSFEAQGFAATLASVQAGDTGFTMAMSSNEEREKTYDVTRGYYEPRVGVLTKGGDPITGAKGLAGKKVACTTGTVQNKFVVAAAPEAEVHTYDGGDQCLQEVLAGRLDAYVCDGAEGQSMRDANEGLVLGLLDRSETEGYVGVYRIMAKKGASFVGAFDGAVRDMLADGTIDTCIKKFVGEDFMWGDDTSAAGSPTKGVKTVG